LPSLIYFVCWIEHPDLLIRGRAVQRNQLQIHEGKWAYCSSGGKAGHVWNPINPLDVAQVKLWERRRNDEKS
jgi:hypothetical protein